MMALVKRFTLQALLSLMEVLIGKHKKDRHILLMCIKRVSYIDKAAVCTDKPCYMHVIFAIFFCHKINKHTPHLQLCVCPNG